jgi:tRNA pseudouridine38-40 synthase
MADCPADQQRVALVIQYLGTGFCGWQRQIRDRSVQATIEDTIAEILGHPVVIHGAGRTDTGVHASAQVAHFDVASPIPPHRWAKVLNTRLPDDILILASCAVPGNWHARFSASWRRYRYVLYTDPQPNLYLKPFSWHYYEPIQVEKMQAAIAPLVGRHHLTAFHRAGSKRPHSWVDVQEAWCRRRGPIVELEVQASGFLYGMMRLLAGMLVLVGRDRLSVEEFTQIWQSERRDLVKYAAPPMGLCLLRIGYPNSPLPEIARTNTLPWFDLTQDGPATSSPSVT